MTNGVKELEFSSADGRLRLYGRDHRPADAPLTLLCMGGLTRNSLDFEDLAKHLSRYRVIAVDQRGRGRSQWDPDAANYTPAVQAGDMFSLLDKLDLHRVVLVGTSNGGLMAMVMGAMQPKRIAGIVLNDIGPHLPMSALQRIGVSLAKLDPVTSWAEAASQAKRINEIALPTYTDADWDAFARRTYLENAHGVPVAAYDPALIDILNSLDFTQELPDLWPVWPSLAEIPILAIRGEVSDIVPRELLAEMGQRHPNTQTVEIPRRGHVPMLDEPEALNAIDAFLQKLEPVA